MSTSRKTLRSVVEKWFSLTKSRPSHVTRLSRAAGYGRHCVLVEAARHEGALSIFFFRHVDGSWNVFPPATERPSMMAARSSDANAARF
nr:hypothetical protein [Paraburkholderia humisilvae]